MSRIFNGPSPRVFTTPPQADFLKILARTLKDEFGQTPESLARVTVLTPTRRAGRALAAAFAALDPDQPATLLPLIRPIGDIDADDPPFEPGELASIAPPAINPVRRTFELARLILAKDEAQGGSMGIGGAIALADPLAALIDDLWTEETGDVTALGVDIKSLLPGHLKDSADFISIVMEAWPKRLKELGASDPAQRRSALLAALADRWRESPPDTPVIAAGSTGSIPAAADLMAAISFLPKGAVILPGFDREMDDKAWLALDADEQHPQRSMKAFLAKVELSREDVRDWPGASVSQTGKARQRILAEALRPAEETSDWLARIDQVEKGWGSGFLADGFNGLSVLEAPTAEAEARAISLILREVLETENKTAMVVTPDRALAERVLANMRGYGVRLDDSAGRPLSQTPVGSFLRLILTAALDPGSSQSLAALWASPLVALGGRRSVTKAHLKRIDLSLRGSRPGFHFDDILTRLDSAPDLSLMERLVWPLETLADEDRLPVADWARLHAKAAEDIATSDNQSGAERLWRNEDGEAAATLIRELLNEAALLPSMSLRDYAELIDQLARTRPVRPRGEVHPRLKLLGPMEARLLSADLVVLAGLNEGVWPAGLGVDPWMSRGMRLEAGLPPREQRLSLAAHDFAQLASAPEAILTRSTRQDGAPAVASRWLWRLETLAKGALGDKAEDALAAPLDYTRIAAALDHVASPKPVGEPLPAPPLEARPDRLSITDIRNWIRDPYSIYAKRVLRLYPEDAHDQDSRPSDRGSAVHAALEHFIDQVGDGPLPEDALETLMEAGHKALIEAGFDLAEMTLEMVRFERMANWFLEWEHQRREAGIQPLALERLGRWEVPGTRFMIRGVADRLDLTPERRIDIIDYKTGSAPSPKATKAGFEPQAPIEAAMLADGAFDDIDPSEPGDLLYLELKGGATPGERKNVNTQKDGETTDDLRHLYEKILRRLIETYNDEATPYRAQLFPKYQNEWGDYDRLSRRVEWSDGDDESGDVK